LARLFRLAYQPPASNTFISEHMGTSHQPDEQVYYVPSNSDRAGDGNGADTDTTFHPYPRPIGYLRPWSHLSLDSHQLHMLSFVLVDGIVGTTQCHHKVSPPPTRLVMEMARIQIPLSIPTPAPE
jgi:hypothetical protein